MKKRNLNDLYYFAQIVEHRGFAAASRALRIPKSTLSKRLLELEKETGTRLIQRDTRNFVVTEIGEEIYRHAAAMLIEAEAAENVIQGRLAEPSGTVRITAAVPVAQQKLAPLLPRLAIAYPKIRIVMNATDRYVDVIQEGFDIALRSHRAPLADSNLVQRRLAVEANWLVASAEYLARVGVPARPEDLAEHDGIVISPSQNTWTLEDGRGRKTTASPRPRYFADEAVLLYEAAKAGLGIANLQSPFCAPMIESGELVRVLADWTGGMITTTMLMPHRRGQLPSVSAIADELAAAFSARR
ncbi:Transcriptional regulator, LysR family [Labilithrix luteola]|uniref:Transcriptional regulator, LysR family n=1 Tax=Labilithrix luteola TaxID=1391654 RepID=A0A0K1PND0_9BACT|nr:LysR substrate-binding domain-containing protein [Labilithrix luteola]AKU95022.1 Transcriptional regulator, LysR family [Labilithrix luteola]